MYTGTTKKRFEFAARGRTAILKGAKCWLILLLLAVPSYGQSLREITRVFKAVDQEYRQIQIRRQIDMASAGIEVIWQGTTGNAALASNWGGILARDTDDTMTIGTGNTQAITSNLGTIPAFGTLTLTGNAVNNEQVVIDSKTYTFKTAITGGDNVDGNVKVGGDAEGSLDNLVAAVNLASGGGSTYAANMTVHPTFYATDESGTVMDAVFKIAGTTGNGKTTTETLGSGSWGSGTTANGAATGLHIKYLYVENGYNEDIMTTGTKATMDFRDALFESDFSTFHWSPVQVGVTSIITVNSGNLFNALNVTSDVNVLIGVSKSALEIKRGGVIWASVGGGGLSPLRQVRMVGVDASLVFTTDDASDLITRLEMNSGNVLSNGKIATFTINGGKLDITSAASFLSVGFTTATVTGGEFTTNRPGFTLNARGGISDFTRVRSAATLTELFKWPSATVLKNSNFVATGTEHNVGGGTSGGN